MATQALTSVFIGAGAGGIKPQQLELKRANRHGLIAGATGTGKTVTLQGIVEGLAAAGVPTFVADVKGDLAGLAMPGSATAKTHEIFAARASEIGGIASNSWWRGGLVSFRQGKSQYSAGWREVDVPGVELHHLTKLRQCAGVGEGLRGGGFAMEQWRLCAPSTMQPWRLGLRWRRWV